MLYMYRNTAVFISQQGSSAPTTETSPEVMWTTQHNQTTWHSNINYTAYPNYMTSVRGHHVSHVNGQPAPMIKARRTRRLHKPVRQVRMYSDEAIWQTGGGGGGGGRDEATCKAITLLYTLHQILGYTCYLDHNIHDIIALVQTTSKCIWLDFHPTLNKHIP